MIATVKEKDNTHKKKKTDNYFSNFTSLPFLLNFH